MFDDEQWVATGATQGFKELCDNWNSARTESWDDLPETESDVWRALFTANAFSNSYPFGMYFCHYLAFRFSPWLEEIAQKYEIELEDGWENMFSTLIFKKTCANEKQILNDIAAIPGMPKQILLDGKEKTESMPTTFFHLVTYGTKDNKDRPNAAILRFLGFACSVQMYPADVELFLQKAFMVANFDLWDEHQFLYFLTFRYAKNGFGDFYERLLKIHDECPASLPIKQVSGEIDTEKIEWLLLNGFKERNHSVENPMMLWNVISSYKGMMQKWGNEKHTSIKATIAGEIMENIDKYFDDIFGEVEGEQTTLTVWYDRSEGLNIPADTIIYADVKPTVMDEYHDKISKTVRISLKVKDTIYEAKADQHGEAMKEITAIVAPKYFDNYVISAWHADNISGALKFDNIGKRLRKAKHTALTEYLYGACFAEQGIKDSISSDIYELLKDTDFSETEFSKLRNPEKYSGDMRINRRTILSLAVIETMLEIQAMGGVVSKTDEEYEKYFEEAEKKIFYARREYITNHDSNKLAAAEKEFEIEKERYLATAKADDRDIEDLSPKEIIEENRQLLWENVNDRLHSCQYFGIYLVEPYERFLAALMACEKPISFYRYLWYCKKKADAGK